MSTETVQIIDRGRGPQLSTSRITVLDVFYYLHRGYDFTFIHRAMPSLSREEFDAIAARREGTPASLPVLTLPLPDRVYHGTAFVDRVVEKILDYVPNAEKIRGAGRLYLPSAKQKRKP
jgi:hypothetical protein